MNDESPLERVLRLAQAQVGSFQRRSPRGRIERVRSFMRNIENEKLPAEEDATRGKAVPGSGNYAYQRNSYDLKDRSAASVKAHDSASRTASADAKAKIRQEVAARQAAERADAARRESAAPGSHEHAEELRGLAREAELVKGRNFLSLKDAHEGMPSAEVASLKAGSDPEAPPESDAARSLHRAASMIDLGQPSLARLHADAIRSAAKSEAAGNPDLLNRMNAAADKLGKLAGGKGLAAQPPETKDYLARQAAARRYAAGK